MGPFAILEQVSEVLLRIKQVEGGPETVVHFNRLKPFVPSTLVAGVPLPNAEEVPPVHGPGVSTGEEHRPQVPELAFQFEETCRGLDYIKSYLKDQTVENQGESSHSSEEDFFSAIKQTSSQENAKQLENLDAQVIQ
ncbi:hypothetical protein DPEC_G00100010 [Dallia pectoralis]|uniref:Uncharacterized protein n=1 Tax=Dallia pectoralis TaxID=75939 RepID=A0ACC2GWK5_DALPE|nr:hypothetical protein DPEC_G00100010 [Dallia pectoralis]